MNLFEYCDQENLDISKLSESSLDALGGSFLENMNPTQEEINRLAMIDSGAISLEEAMQDIIHKAKMMAGSASSQ
jgi:hypothetical protein